MNNNPHIITDKMLPAYIDRSFEMSAFNYNEFIDFKHKLALYLGLKYDVREHPELVNGKYHAKFTLVDWKQVPH